MACFIVPMVEAIATTALRKSAAGRSSSFVGRHLRSLELMLWGGTIMLVVDHILNGELTWKFPFFTALDIEGGWSVMLHEMVTVGLPMAVVITVLWAIFAVVKDRRQASVKA